ncbi:MAG: gephyrin-like molybdotransferase Glp [Bacteroidota bacterium]
MRQDISVEEARRIVLATARPLPTESVPLAEALGRVLAEPVVAPDAVPPFDASAMDGVAVRLGDVAELPATLPVVGASWAGAPFTGTMPPGAAVQIATGAVVPPEAEAVVPVEWTDGITEAVTVHRRPDAGHSIRPRGSAIEAGAPVLAKGTRVTPAVVGALATVGVSSVPCSRPPRVRIVVTGDEVVPAGRPLRLGQIRDANGPILAAQVRWAGGIPEVVHTGDDPGSLARVLDDAPDLVLLTGGVSVGDRDRVRDDLSAAGVTWAFWRVRQRPGKPLLFGTHGATPVLGLPGNPVSASVGVEVYARPLLAAMQSVASPRRTEEARLGAPISKAPGLHTFARVTATRASDGTLKVVPAGHQASHAVLSLLGDGLAHLPADWDEAPVGAWVEVEPFAWSTIPSLPC